MIYAMRYDSTPGRGSSRTPNVSVSKAHDWTLVMVLHPKCPCSVSSLRALREVMVRYKDTFACEVCIAGDRTTSDSENEKLAATIPGAKVEWITPKAAVERFGAHTSGQTYIFEKSGKLAYSGGLTPGRAVDNPRFALEIVEGVLHHEPVATGSSVFGCPLEDARS